MHRVLAISDLHIGGADYPMLGHPELLAGFLERLAALAPAQGDELELVIHGDFVDFLAESPYSAWTAKEADAETKLAAIFQRNARIFDALGRCAQGPRRLTILLGNHDIELALPRVRAALLRRLGTDPHRCLFIHNNECHRIGDLLIEHGNRYDTWNAIDHDGLREVVSCLSRGEEPPAGAPQVCPGSSLVERVMNPLKERYHFIDLLKPEDKVVPLLLLALEPKLKRSLSRVWGLAANYLTNARRELQWAWAPAGRTRELVSNCATDPLPPDLENAFADDVVALSREVVGSDPGGGRVTLGPDPDSLAAMLQRGAEIPEKRLEKLRIALRTCLAGDLSFAKADDSGPYTAAAHGMIARGVARVVVMGHTHLQRDIAFPGQAGRYLNTGTWADLLHPDLAALEDRAPGRPTLVAWLRRLASNDLAGIRVCEPGFADVSLDHYGHVVACGLRTYREDPL